MRGRRLGSARGDRGRLAGPVPADQAPALAAPLSGLVAVTVAGVIRVRVITIAMLAAARMSRESVTLVAERDTMGAIIK